MVSCILIVDDEPDIRVVLAEALEDEGYSVRMAADGQTALDLVRRHPPALILLDLMLPVLDGPACARAVRDEGYDGPIVVMSARADVGQTAAAIGAQAWLAKPFDFDRLFDYVDRLVDRPLASPDAHN